MPVNKDFIEDLLKQVSKEEIMPRFLKTGYEIKDDGSLLTEADLVTDRRICTALKKEYPDIAFLSEEMSLEEQTILLENHTWLWVLDPLDGTSNFAAGIPLFATSLALLHEGSVVMGFTYDPVRDEMFSAVKGEGARLNGFDLKCKESSFSLDKSIAIVDFKRLPMTLCQQLLLDPPFKSQRNLGSCVLEWAWMASNRGHVYLHGGMKLWDLAAGTIILSEAGGYSSTMEGETVFRAKMQPRSVVISPDKKIFSHWQEYLQKSLSL
ncbi:MAG: inositol monophosphatase [Thiotrichaceae bacterium]|nr:inositol monophosphatase [Thiotrichaceae bacterium]